MNIKICRIGMKRLTKKNRENGAWSSSFLQGPQNNEASCRSYSEPPLTKHLMLLTFVQFKADGRIVALNEDGEPRWAIWGFDVKEVTRLLSRGLKKCVDLDSPPQFVLSSLSKHTRNSWKKYLQMNSRSGSVSAIHWPMKGRVRLSIFVSKRNVPRAVLCGLWFTDRI